MRKAIGDARAGNVWLMHKTPHAALLEHVPGYLKVRTKCGGVDSAHMHSKEVGS